MPALSSRMTSQPTQTHWWTVLQVGSQHAACGRPTSEDAPHASCVSCSSSVVAHAKLSRLHVFKPLMSVGLLGAPACDLPRCQETMEDGDRGKPEECLGKKSEALWPTAGLSVFLKSTSPAAGRRRWPHERGSTPRLGVKMSALGFFCF